MPPTSLNRRQGLGLGLAWAGAALAGQARGQEAAMLQGVRRGVYRSHDRDLTVLVAQPTVSDGPMNGAALVLLHGAGGIRRDFGNFYGNARRLAALGYMVVMPDYFGDADGGRASEDPGRWAGAVKDAALWTAGLRGVDPARVGAMGYSRGGYLAAEVGVQEPGIAAVVGVCSAGNIDARDMKRRPPVLLIHAAGDPVVRPVRTRRWARELERAGVLVETHVIDVRRHGFFETEWADIFDRADAFFRRTLV
ncbi:dienelactone hydrolase family protein [Brevundimonas sp.]|uniref:dienelactone hydrolase family protein n=1 Tax=Brevundimonas sp. TaxID=1871086 RepID=UPI002FDA18B8